MTNQSQGSRSTLGRMISKVLGREMRLANSQRRRARPVLENLETRQLMTVSSTVNALCAIEAVSLAPTMLSAMKSIAKQYGNAVAYGMEYLTLSNIGNVAGITPGSCGNVICGSELAPPPQDLWGQDLWAGSPRVIAHSGLPLIQDHALDQRVGHVGRMARAGCPLVLRHELGLLPTSL